MVKLAVAISTICMILNFFANIGMHTDYRYGMRAYNFLYSRVGDFYNACVLWIIILTASLYYRNSKNTRFKELLIEYTSFMVKLAVAISTICMILNFFANIGMHTDYRYGMRAFNFLYSRLAAALRLTAQP